MSKYESKQPPSKYTANTHPEIQLCFDFKIVESF